MKKRNTRQPAATPDTTHLPDSASALLTPSDVLTQACACCGAILPAPLSRWNDHGLVFTTRIGTPIEPRNLIRHFKTVLKKAALPLTIRFHDLRHSCATLLIAQGVHPRVVMEILRHSQISTTMNTYGHVLPRLQRDATTKIEELFEAPDKEQPPDAVD